MSDLEQNNDDVNNEVIENNELLDGEQVTDESQDNDDGGGDSDNDEFVITLGDEQNEDDKEEHEVVEKAPEWVKELRKQTKEQRRKIKELEQQLQSRQVAEPISDELPPEPQIDDDDIDYDPKLFAQRVVEWHEKKRVYESKQQQVQQTEQSIRKQWDDKIQTYEANKKALKVRDFEEAEAVVIDTLNLAQRGIIIKGAKNPEQLIYALGKNPSKAQELAKITDPIDFAFAVAKLESNVIMNKKTAVAPEKKVTGSGNSQASSKQLDKLREEAAKTGDFSKVVAYKRANGLR